MINVSQHQNQLFEAVRHHSFICTNYENPYDCLKNFFNDRDLKTHLKMLKRWRKLVQTYDHFEVNTFHNPLFHHKLMCELLNAAYLLHHEEIPFVLKPAALSAREQEIFLAKECLAYTDYPKHLTNEELINPFLVFEDLFASMDLAAYHQHLYVWLTTSFSPNVMLEDLEKVKEIYLLLRRLIEACWLIYIREGVGNLEITEEQDIVEKTVVSTPVEEEIPAHVLQEFKQFLDVVPVSRLNRGLRKMLVDYLFYNIDGLPNDFEEILTDFYWLTDLLDEIQGKTIDSKFE